MDTLTQLTPVQAWLIGAIDQPTLFDRLTAVGDPSLAHEYGRVLSDPAYAVERLRDAQEAVGV
jgi:hypothetical protein